jgi:hypothetical protein
LDKPVTVHVIVPVPPGDRVTEELVQETASPEALEIVELTSIVPEKPLMLVNVTVKLLEDPWTIDSELGLTVMLKVPTDTVMVMVWTSEPLVAVTVTV